MPMTEWKDERNDWNEWRQVFMQQNYTGKANTYVYWIKKELLEKEREKVLHTALHFITYCT